MSLTESNTPHLYDVFSRVHSEWYEDFQQYQPMPEFLRIVRKVLPLSWKVISTGMWVQVDPPQQILPRQGWKLHISARPEDCETILNQCARLCVEYNVSFKFLSDRFMFDTVLSKGWSRESSGKFVTLYPVNIQQFEVIADALHESLSTFKGPYILSDQRYKGSQTVYYRYGAFRGYPLLSPYGIITDCLRSPDGTLVDDAREPVFSLPPWISDPFERRDLTEASEETDSIYLKDGRYRMDEAIKFTVTGGVYKSLDMETGETVIIKEARPDVSVSKNGTDAAERLEKEYRLLKKLSTTGITPKPLDFFRDWEHNFLVEELVDGEVLSAWTLGFDDRFNSKKILAIADLLKIAINLTKAVQTIHEHNVLINDFSPGNILVSENNFQLYFIDLEMVWEIGVDAPLNDFGTAGFRPDRNVDLWEKSDDVYGLGTLFLSLFVPINDFLALKPDASQIFLDVAETAGNLPIGLSTLVHECLDEDKNRRPTVIEVIDQLNEMPCSNRNILPLNRDRVNISHTVLTESLRKILDYVKSSIGLERRDRLFPADPYVFMTNPLNLANGASGVAHMFLSVEGKVPDKVIAWMLSHEISQENYPPSLYVGLSGIAWVFWKLELQEIALRVIKMAANHPLLDELPNIYFGSAGVGLSCLFFYSQTEDTYWLEQAMKIGNRLINLSEENEHGCYWPDPEGNIWCGYARGQSGVALFLLYLYLTTGEGRFRDSGRRALAYDLAQVKEASNGHLMIPNTSADSLSAEGQKIATPYWADGSAGVCTSLLRYFAAFSDDDDKLMLEHLIPNTFDRILARSPGLSGLAGLGNLHLDAFQFIGDFRYLEEALQVAEAILRFQIKKPEGIAFPGNYLHRISTDFETGSSGIACFLHRLVHRSNGVGNFNFVLDELLEG